MTTEAPSEKSSPPGIRPRAAFIALLASLDALYLLFHHVQVNGGYQWGPSICDFGGVFRCSDVARSPYAEIAGVPIASAAVLYYLFFLFFLLFIPPRDESAPAKERYANALLVLSLAGLPGTILYLLLSAFVLGQVCLFCMVLYLASILLCLITYFASERKRSGVRPGLRESITSGLSELAYFFRIRRGRLLALGTVLGALFLLAAPALLVTFVFEPWRASLVGKVEMERLYSMWQEEIRHELSVNLDGPPAAKDFSEGGGDNAVLLVVYSDFECPFCRRAAGILRSLVTESNGRLRLVFKNYPLDSACNPGIARSRHEYACTAAAMARCAGLESDEAFWRMHDALFSLGMMQWNEPGLMQLSAELGLDKDKIKRCVADSAVDKRVSEDAASGKAVGVLGTPTIFVDGKRLSYSNLGQIAPLVRLILLRAESRQKLF